jgi:hypothetical protein
MLAVHSVVVRSKQLLVQRLRHDPWLLALQSWAELLRCQKKRNFPTGRQKWAMVQSLQSHGQRHLNMATRPRTTLEQYTRLDAQHLQHCAMTHVMRMHDL